MVQWLSKSGVAAVLLFVGTALIAQSVPEVGDKDYKDPKSHEKFRKRRLTVANWQINQLKNGALVVRLKTNSNLINGFKQRGDDLLAEKARLEQAAINKNYIRAFMDKYDFSKVYFIYSSSSDSLLKGTRSGIFVDSTLAVNPAITMNEKFYLLAEPDYIYNSSIGFIPEDSASTTIEQGNPSSSEALIVVKNKYGHQLKDPFPYSQAKQVFPKATQIAYVRIGNENIPFTVTSMFGGNPSGAVSSNSPWPSHTINGQRVELSIPRLYTYDVLSQVVQNFTADLTQFHRRSAPLSKTNPDVVDAQLFFY